MSEPPCTVRRNREPLAVELKFELILDEPKFFREMRVGCWRWVHDYESGEGTWYWEGHEPKAAARQPREISQPGIAIAKIVPEAPQGGLLRREELRRLL